jgi:hypothetical protein
MYMRRFWTKFYLVAVAVSLMSAESAFAQGYGMGATPVIPRSNRGNPNAAAAAAARQMETPFQGSFTIEAVGSRGLEVVFDNGSKGLVAPDRTCKTEVTGSADPAALKPGLLVKFNAQFDKKGRSTAPVNELEIVSPQTAMAEKDKGVLNMEKVAGKKGEKETTSGLGPGTTLGHIKEFKNNELTVEAPDGTVKAELGANPAIKVNVNDFHFAQAGDKVDVQGYYLPTKPNEAIARQMKITLSSPLGSDPSKKKSQAKTGVTASK